jgi:hypothetical protein
LPLSYLWFNPANLSGKEHVPHNLGKKAPFTGENDKHETFLEFFVLQ